MKTNHPTSERVNAQRLRQLAQQLQFDKTAFQHAMQLAGLIPDRQAWQNVLEKIFLLIGVTFLVVGLMTWLAFNWAQLHEYAKLALPQLAMVAAIVLAINRGLDSMLGKAALVAGAVCVGLSLAMYGQIYQTGADPYSLFLGWAVLILAWTGVGRSAGLWLLVMVLLNLALILFWTQVWSPPLWDRWRDVGPIITIAMRLFEYGLAQWLFVLNVMFVVVWEAVALRGVSWMQSRYVPRLIGMAALVMVTANVLSVVIDHRNILYWPSDHTNEAWRWWSLWISVLGYLAATWTGVWFYVKKRHDLAMLILLSLAMIVVLTTLFGTVLFTYSPAKFATVLGYGFLVGLFLVTQVYLVVRWLRRVKASWQVSDE